MVTVLDRALGRRTALLALLGGAAGGVLLDLVGVGLLMLGGPEPPFDRKILSRSWSPAPS